jgi:putative addiction module component (TIGR02574 family)
MPNAGSLAILAERLGLEERIQVAEAIWNTVINELETAPIPNWQKAELERRLADSVANPDAVRRWGDVEVEALTRIKR